MRFTTVILSAASLAAATAQQTVWVTQTVIGTDCFPSTRPGTITMAPPSNTTTPILSLPTTLSTSPNVIIGINATSTTGGSPGTPPTSSPTQSVAIGGAGAVSPASGFALAGVLAGIMAIIA
ncbi:hypothetical protein TWF696_007471 [Orbilia brochopaga]|uniref:Uncharacterized protein n=1 Tax=Orbilia brochopaga TaxID=3140254 RepID=A0AAV9UNP2_9PEZI